MIHVFFFFFSVHLTIYRSAKSQPSSLRFELICRISDSSAEEKSLLSDPKISPDININLTARFGLTFRANLRNIQTKEHISLKLIQ